MFWRHHRAIARASTRIEFQEALIRFSMLGFPVAYGKFLSLQYEDYIYLISAQLQVRKKNILNNIESNF